jgi:ribosomal protein S18 acetylase RimI-like enzyme
VLDDPLTYRALSEEALLEASELVARVFDAFVAPGYSPEGVQEIHRYIQPEAFRLRAQANHLGFIALAANKIVGVIELRGHDHISLLFVAPEFQRRGIARELLRLALLRCVAGKPGLAEISVHASPYAVPIYVKLGFRRTGERQVKNGVDFTPMALRLPNSLCCARRIDATRAKNRPGGLPGR